MAGPLNPINMKILEVPFINLIMLQDSMTSTCLAKILVGNQLVNQIFCSREYFNEVPPIQASMPKNEPKDFTSCLYYSDNCDPKNNDNLGMIFMKIPR